MFNKVGRDGSGKANLVVQEKTCAWGVVFELGAADWDVLDRFEPGYARRSCQVILDSGSRARGWLRTVFSEGSSTQTFS